MIDQRFLVELFLTNGGLIANLRGRGKRADNQG
jgi:hypothetical protein